MFIPATPEDMKKLGWGQPDIILVSGDTYIDSPYNGTAIIGHWLMKHGFKVAVIAQPGLDNNDIERFGEPRLFWSVSAGCVDSMVANYTSTGKFRKDDDFTPSGINNRRPDRACISYTNLIKKHFKKNMIVLGGIEASLRRIMHYDLWSDSVRRSILFDSKADVITYGMAEIANLELARAVAEGRDWRDINGICYISKERVDGNVDIPSYEDCSTDMDAFIKAFRMFYYNNDPHYAKGLTQKHGDRYLIQNPPSEMDTETLDSIYDMEFENAVHPFYLKQGKVKAMETIKQSITTHRGCYGECNFCAIAVHQGRTVISRSEESIMNEAERFTKTRGFNGIIYDLGGPTANMYGIECLNKEMHGACRDKRCLYPNVCENMPVDHSAQINLLRKVSEIDGIKKVFVNSGIRYDMIIADEEYGKEYLDAIVKCHISGQMKIAPEHISDDVLALMGKPGKRVLMNFRQMFTETNERLGKEQFLTYYFIAAHPGCYEHHMHELNEFVHTKLRTNPEQVQVFTPTPSTMSTLMYYTRRAPDNRRDLKSEHSMQMKQKQKDILMKSHSSPKKKLKSGASVKDMQKNS